MTGNHKITIPTGRLQLDTFEATARVISNFAAQHFKAAVLFRDHVVRLEVQHHGQEFGAFFEDIRSYATACIMASAASLEVLINELFIAHNSELRKQLSDFETQFWGRGGIERKTILKKYQLALSLLNAPRFDESVSPYREAWGVVELRNALVHFKPTWDPERRRNVELADVLDGRFPPSPFPDQAADFVTMKCMGTGCVNWVIQSVVAFVTDFDSRTKLDTQKIAGFIRAAA